MDPTGSGRHNGHIVKASGIRADSGRARVAALLVCLAGCTPDSSHVGTNGGGGAGGSQIVGSGGVTGTAGATMGAAGGGGTIVMTGSAGVSGAGARGGGAGTMSTGTAGRTGSAGSAGTAGLAGTAGTSGVAGAAGRGGTAGTSGIAGSGAGGTDPVPVCTSNATWNGKNDANMNPGMSCLRCHPTFTVGGTVYPTEREPDNCNGINGTTAGVEVQITGVDGKVLTLTPGPTGNFYSTAPVATPFQVKLVRGAATRVMTDAQTTGDCNSCHTEYGAHLAPGRIMSP